SNSDLSHCHSSGIDCANVPYLTGPNGLTVESGIKLIVEFGKTFAPGQGVSTTSSGDASSLAGDILIQTGAMLSMGGAPLGVGGDYNNQGMFSQSAGQSVAFTATATGHTIVPGSGNFQGVSFNGSGGGWSFVAPVVIEENLLMLSGTLSGTRDITVNGGQVTADGGIISLTGGTFLLDGTGDFGGTPAWTFNNLTFGDGAGTATTTATGAGGITVTGVLTIAANQTLNAKLKTWTLSGTGTPLVITGTLTDSTPSSTFVYTGNGATTITASTAYHNLRVFPGGASVTHTLASGTFTLSGNLEIGGNGNGASTVVDAGTNNPTINVGGSVTICAVSCSNQMTFTKSSSAFAFSGSTTPVTWTDNNPTTKQDVGAVSIDGPKEVDLGSSVSATKVNVTEGDTLDLQSSGYTLTLTGSGVGASRPFSVGGTLSAGTDSTVSFTGSGSSDIESQTYWNLDFTPVSGSLSYFLDSGTFSMGGDWTMTGATSLNVFATANPVIAVEGDVTIGANAALTASSTAAFTVKGNWSNTGTFTHNSGTVTFNATATGKTIAPGGSDFFNVVFNGSGGGWSFSSAVVIEGDLTMSAGTLSGTNDVTVLGTVVGTAGIINFTAGGTFEQRVAAGQSFGTTSGSANWQFFNLTFSNSSGTGQTITANSGGTGTVGVIGALTIGKGADAATTTFDAGNRTWILSDGSCPCTPFVVDGTNGVFDAGTSTFRYAGKVGAFTIAAETYYNLESKPGSTATHTLASGTFTVNNNLEIGTGINASSVTAATNNPVLNVSNNVTINATATLIASGSSAFTVGGNWSNNGIFTHNSGTVTFDAATTSVISGATAWNNFTSATPGKTLQFEAGTTQTFEGAFTVTGAVGNLIAIQSDATGTKWTADFTNQQGSEGSPTVTHAAVQDSGCAPASANAVLDSTSQDDGNNEDCWVFFVAEQGEPAPSPGMGSFTPLQINTVEVREVTPTAVLVSWRTLAEVTTEIAWAVSVPELGEPAYRDSSFKTAHEVLIENLAPGTAYVFAIYANAPAWGTVSAGPFPFLTLEEETEQPQEPQEPDEPAPEGRVVFSGNQIQSILDFLSSFSVDSATLARVESALRGSPVPQAPGSGAIPGIPAGFS
ncbi:MAG: hypothetical protein Q8P12_03645, partial [bacterium]|nr:hypothetical protein [bacterium]